MLPAAAAPQVARCRSTPDFLVLLSLAGGTGSGLGSRLLESLRCAYPDAYIAVGAVAPSPEGDTPVQSLNVVMAAQFMQARFRSLAQLMQARFRSLAQFMQA